MSERMETTFEMLMALFEESNPQFGRAGGALLTAGFLMGLEAMFKEGDWAMAVLAYHLDDENRSGFVQDFTWLDSMKAMIDIEPEVPITESEAVELVEKMLGG